MVREIIKDIEDVSGDHNSGYQTLPVVFGVERSKYIAAGYSFLLVVILGFWIFEMDEARHLYNLIFILLFLIIPIFFVGTKTLGSTNKKQFYIISQACKIIMFSGLIYLTLLTWN